MNILETTELKKYYGKEPNITKALDGVNLSVEKGEFVAIMGESGSGKTTLLNILSALDMPTEGSVQFLDKNLEQMTEKDREMLRRYEMGFVFQSIALIPTMTAYENVEFALRLAKNDVINENTHDRVSELLERVGLSKRMDHMPDQLSGGEQQRVAIARAVVHRPKVVFADEPTGALDTASGFEVMRLFRELIDDEGITIVMTTHDPNLMELGDEVFELSDGIVI